MDILLAQGCIVSINHLKEGKLCDFFFYRKASIELMSSSSREEDFFINSAVLLIKMIYLSFKGDSCIYLDRRKGRIAEKKNYQCL